MAERAGISTAYLTKIEQGRVDVPSHVLGALASVLQLSFQEQEYAFALAGKTAFVHASLAHHDISPVLRQFLEGQGANPAQIINHRWDFLAWNEATCALMVDLDALPPQARNLVVMMFTQPVMRRAIGNWEENAKGMLAEFRADYGRYHSDPSFDPLIRTLSDASPEFSRWWSELPQVGSPSEIDKTLHVQSGEPLRFRELALEAVDHPGLRVLLFLPQDEETQRTAQRLLDEWRQVREGMRVDRADGAHG